ncbi:MAG: sigma-54 dependent transcriptional regulator, partial [Thermoanaerobaculia bacterium]
VVTLRAGGRPERGQALRVCEKLELFREAVAGGDRSAAQELAEELGLSFDAGARVSSSSELDLLRTAATREFPFAPRDLPQSWTFSTRNRLGQWSSIGSDSFEGSRLDAILANGAPDWMRCSDRELLFVAGSSRWTPETRDALTALFRLRADNERMHRLLAEEETSAGRCTSVTPDGMVGESMTMRAVYELVSRIAARDVQVCILGESGTGKELVARAIHKQSPRRQKPFVTLNCAALPENLVESEMFGHMRGAFTGADRDRAGLIESADGGTLFLDEIGELPLTAQAKLLRFLQDGEYRRVGDTTVRSADVRIVSATNRPLEARVEAGQFRDDLYYRIRGVEVHLPPLRDRGGDIALLAMHFVAAERQRHHGGPSRLSGDTEAAVSAYAWPGNVRELQNTIRAAHALAGDARQVELEHLPERLRSALHHAVQAGSYQDAVMRFKRDLIEKSLAEASGNQNRAAAMLRISRQALAYQIRELGILVGRSMARTV